jgi:hypothetical protein
VVRHVERGADDNERNHRNRQVEIERPSPAEEVDEQSADERTDDAAHREDRALVAEPPAELPRRHDVGDDRHRQRAQPARADALDEPEHEELVDRLCDPAQHGADREDRDRGIEEPLAAIQVAELAHERQRSHLPDEVRGHDPRDARQPTQVVGDARQRGGDDRAVDRAQDHPELEPDEHDDQAAPRDHRRRLRGSRRARAEPARTASCRSL